MDIVREGQKALFRIRARISSFADISRSPDANCPVDIQYCEPNLIIMSRETEREIMRLDYSNSTVFCSHGSNVEPRTFCGVRVAYDDSLSFGQFIVAEMMQ